MPDDNAAVREALFTLLRTALGRERTADRDFTGLSAAEWQALFSLATRQGTASMVWDGIRKLEATGRLAPGTGIPRGLRIAWAVHVEEQERRYERQRKALVRLTIFYAAQGFRTMLLKGHGLADCYPVPEHRPCGDIDIWLYGHQQEADARISAAWGTAVDKSKHHHTTFTVDGVNVENHYDFLNTHSHTSNRILETQLKELASREGEPFCPGTSAADSTECRNDRRATTATTADAVPGETGLETPLRAGAEIGLTLPPPDFNALFLLRHAGAHFAAEHIGLRHVTDWMLFVERYGTQIDWETVEHTACEMNMHRFLHCMNAISIDCLGMNAAQVPPFERNPALERRVLNEILTPEFGESAPSGGLPKILRYKCRRWWANRWKHRIVYREGLVQTFLVQTWSHLLKPRSLTH